MEKTNTKITQEREQFRTTVPKKLMDQSGNKKGSVTAWSLKKGKLKAEIISHEEFMERVKDSQKLRNKTKDVFSESSEVEE